ERPHPRAGSLAGPLARTPPAAQVGAVGARRRRPGRGPGAARRPRQRPRPDGRAGRAGLRRPRQPGVAPGRGPPSRHRPHRDHRRQRDVRRGDGPARLAAADRGEPRRRPLRRRLLQPDDAQRHRRGRRRAARHRRHGHHHLARRAHLRADRHADRDLPRGVRPGPPRPVHHVPRRRHDGHPVGRGRPVRVRAVRAVLRPRRALRHRRRRGAVGAHGPGRGARGGGDAQARPRRAARGVVRPRRAEVAHHPQGRPAGRRGRHRHRHHPRRRPGHRRDGAAAAHRRHDDEPEPQPVRGAHGDPAGLRVLQLHAAGREPRAVRRPGLDSSAGPHDHRAGPEPGRADHRQALRPQGRSL
ncbi:MAG: Phosphate transport system permease protein PstA, partial [uncultured Solirubrobacteraceae bacterium]